VAELETWFAVADLEPETLTPGARMTTLIPVDQNMDFALALCDAVVLVQVGEIVLKPRHGASVPLPGSLGQVAA
jgi:hypothetical protein